MRKVQANNSVLFLGTQGENIATQIQFPFVKKWVEMYGYGVFQLLYQRPTETEAYAVVLGMDDENVTWDVTNTDVAIVGNGRCELYYFVDGAVAISMRWITKVVEAIADVGGTPPEPWESWVEDVLTAGSEAKEAADDAEEAKNLAETAKDEATQSAQEAVQSADDAETSAQAAQAAANSMSFVSFTMNNEGDLLVNNSERLGTTDFSLTNEGDLEVEI